jgi:hypothetical protein
MDSDIPDIFSGIVRSRAGTLLIEKISTAIGVWWEPSQIVRVARAEAERDRIKAESQLQITELERRALHRVLAEETKKQRNIERVIHQALPQLDEKADPAKVEDDWITNFFDKCKLVSDAEMQSLWSHILAGEASAPGSFSKRAVNYLSSLDKNEAKLFTNLCKFGWKIGQIVPLIYDPDHEIYKRYGITNKSLKHLEDIGLIRVDDVGRYSVSYPVETALPIKYTVFYYEEPTQIEFSGQTGYIEVTEHVRGYILPAGYVRLTNVGQELAPICGSTPDDEFRNYVVTKWKEWGYIKVEVTEDRSDQE